MSSRLHSRKKPLNQDDGPDLEVQKSQSPSSGGGGDDKTHRRTTFLGRLVRSEIGCAIKVIIGFLLFGLFLGYVILHNQQRKVRFYFWFVSFRFDLI